MTKQRKDAPNGRCGANPIGKGLVMKVASSLVGNLAAY